MKLDLVRIPFQSSRQGGVKERCFLKRIVFLVSSDCWNRLFRKFPDWLDHDNLLWLSTLNSIFCWGRHRNTWFSS